MAEFVLKTINAPRSMCWVRSLRRADAWGESAFEESGYGYRSDHREVPCVCLRIRRARQDAARLARDRTRRKGMMDSDAPTALWLTPSETIRSQTISALQRRASVRAALEAAYGQRFQICDLESVATVPPQDFGRHAVVVLATTRVSASRIRISATHTRSPNRSSRLPRSPAAAARGA